MTPPTQPWKPPRLAHGTPAAIITGRQAISGQVAVYVKDVA